MVRQLRHVAIREEQAGVLMAHQFGGAGDRRADDRRPEQHGFQHHPRQPLAARGKYQRVEGGQVFHGIALKAGEDHAIAKTQLRRLARQIGLLATRPHQYHFPACVGVGLMKRPQRP